MSSNVAVVALKLVIVFEKSFLLVAIEAGIVKFVFKSLPNSLDVAIKTAGWPSNPVLVPIILMSLNVCTLKPAPVNIVWIFLSKNLYLGPAYAWPCFTLWLTLPGPGIILLTLLK